jgi:hypothetical protein
MNKNPRGPHKDLRCGVCLFEYTLAEVKGKRACPNCGNVLGFLQLSQDGYVRVNWHDLRILATYARRWTIHFDMTKAGNRFAVLALDNILESLEAFKPKGAKDLVEPAEEKKIIDDQERARTAYLTRPADAIAPELLFKKDATGQIPSPFFKRGGL